MESPNEYDVLTTCYPTLVSCLQLSPNSVVDQLIPLGILPANNVYQIQNQNLDNIAKARMIVNVVLYCVQKDRSVFKSFIKAMRASGKWTETAVNELEKTASSLKIQLETQPTYHDQDIQREESEQQVPLDRQLETIEFGNKDVVWKRQCSQLPASPLASFSSAPHPEAFSSPVFPTEQWTNDLTKPVYVHTYNQRPSKSFQFGHASAPISPEESMIRYGPLSSSKVVTVTTIKNQFEQELLRPELYGIPETPPAPKPPGRRLPLQAPKSDLKSTSESLDSVRMLHSSVASPTPDSAPYAHDRTQLTMSAYPIQAAVSKEQPVTSLSKGSAPTNTIIPAQSSDNFDSYYSAPSSESVQEGMANIAQESNHTLDRRSFVGAKFKEEQSLRGAEQKLAGLHLETNGVLSDELQRQHKTLPFAVENRQLMEENRQLKDENRKLKEVVSRGNIDEPAIASHALIPHQEKEKIFRQYIEDLERLKNQYDMKTLTSEEFDGMKKFILKSIQKLNE